MGTWDDVSYYEDEANQAEFIEETLKNISEDGVRNYLGAYGDAVDDRIQSCMKEARMLVSAAFYPSAIVMAVTAIELTVRFLLLRPLMQAAFLSEDWANLFTQRIASGQGSSDRQILPSILAFHGVNLQDIKLSDGRRLWNEITETVYPARNLIVHRGEPASQDDAILAIQCAEQLRKAVVEPYAKKLGFTLETTKCWQRTKTMFSGAVYNPRSPFTDKSSLPLAPEIKRDRGADVALRPSAPT
ncbi:MULTISPECIES: hypothetical protein [unclassified Bradyrhizobium]|uniref:hypothetical protein n=1 Tax=unclassified Bradyrhizobium TaxID=2631580 RepID=UPI002916A2E1|nr:MULTISPECIES: hypothetical protein [unclassified Bradyrhizobium]